jgi:hypothetical protein
MALLGLLQLMASQGASVDELYEAAKYVSASWYPQQALETAIFFQEKMGLAHHRLFLLRSRPDCLPPHLPSAGHRPEGG